MLDIETLSTKPSAAIVSVACVKFKLDSPLNSMTQKYYSRVDIDSCKDINLHIDDDTLKWWKSQSTEAKKEAFDPENRKPIKKVLSDLQIFLSDVEYIWANSPSFDCIILETAYRRCSLIPPWKFWNLRDCRTVYALANVSLKDEGPVAHHALQDCAKQISCLHKALQKLKTS